MVKGVAVLSPLFRSIYHVLRRRAVYTVLLGCALGRSRSLVQEAFDWWKTTAVPQRETCSATLPANVDVDGSGDQDVARASVNRRVERFVR